MLTGFIMRSVLAVSGVLTWATSVAAEPIETLIQREINLMEFIGCFSSNEGLIGQTSWTYQSSGWCWNHCLKSRAVVFVTTNGSDCLYGNQLPPSAWRVPNDKCSIPCNGWLQERCGGNSFYLVYLTGLEANALGISSSTISSSSSNGILIAYLYRHYLEQLISSALFWAAKHGRVATAQKLLGERAAGQTMSLSSLTPMMLAAENGHEAMVKLLLATEAVDPDYKNSQFGWTPLSLAAKHGHTAVVKLLLATGVVEPDSKDHSGWTPLSLAAQRGHEAVVKLL